jgi:hypothetical protein
LLRTMTLASAPNSRMRVARTKLRMKLELRYAAQER